MKIINVVAAIILSDNKVLIAQRLKGEFAGLWEFPGGKIEAKESPQEALKREIMEEMELDITINDYLMTAHYTYPTFTLHMDCYFCEIASQSVHLHDHTAIRWIDYQADFSSISWVPADVQVMEAIQNHFKSIIN